jgi:hypothetical protein
MMSDNSDSQHLANSQYLFISNVSQKNNSDYVGDFAGFAIAYNDLENFETLDCQDLILDYLSNYYIPSFEQFSAGELLKDTGLMPPGVKYVGRNFVVYERPPTFKNIFYIPDRVHSSMSTGESVYRIPIPWQLYIATFNNEYYLDSVRMYFMKSSLTNIEQELYLAPMPNFYTNSELCRPFFGNMEEVERYTKDVPGIISSSYDWIWNNGTNHDLTEAMLHIVLQRPNHEDHQNTIMKHSDLAIYNKLFHNSSCTSRYMSTLQVDYIFKHWEAHSLLEVCSFDWPNISEDRFFPAATYTNSSICAYVMSQNRFMDWVGEFSQNCYPDEEEQYIFNLIENSQDDEIVSEYCFWLVDNNKIYLPQLASPLWDSPHTFNSVFSYICSYIKRVYPIKSPDVLDDINVIRDYVGQYYSES